MMGMVLLLLAVDMFVLAPLRNQYCGTVQDHGWACGSASMMSLDITPVYFSAFPFPPSQAGWHLGGPTLRSSLSECGTHLPLAQLLRSRAIMQLQCEASIDDAEKRASHWLPGTCLGYWRDGKPFRLSRPPWPQPSYHSFGNLHTNHPPLSFLHPKRCSEHVILSSFHRSLTRNDTGDGRFRLPSLLCMTTGVAISAMQSTGRFF